MLEKVVKEPKTPIIKKYFINILAIVLLLSSKLQC